MFKGFKWTHKWNKDMTPGGQKGVGETERGGEDRGTHLGC